VSDSLRDALAVTDEAVTAAENAYAAAWKQRYTGRDTGMRAALEAAYRVDVPRPQAIVEEVAEVLGVQMYGEEALTGERQGDKQPLSEEAYRLAEALRNAGLFKVPTEPRPLLDREAVRAQLREMAFWAEPAEYVDGTTDAVMELARPMPTQGQVEEAVTKAWAAPDASLTSIIAAVEALIRGES
jgi:hypothetical protein